MKAPPLVLAEIVAGARAAATRLATATTGEKDRLLLALAGAVEAGAADILAANSADVEEAERGGRSGALLDRLRLTPARLAGMAEGIRRVAALPDPIGAMAEVARRPNGMLVGRMRIPIGVILAVYEARPSVTTDAASLCLKAGSAVILRSGSETRRTMAALRRATETLSEVPAGAMQILVDADHEAVRGLLGAAGIDLAIARGGEALIRSVTASARMPVLKHYKGVCHLYVDRAADLEMARRLVVNAKVERPAVCNALETLLVDRAVAVRFLPQMVEDLRQAGVEVRGDAATVALVPGVVPAGEEDWGQEYLDLILAVRVVDGFEAAAAHIRRYGTGLAEVIVTNDLEAARRFVREVDSAAVLVNASTRLVDGGEFGLGAEIGISTDRMGPRGPMGLVELTTTKWVVLGSGQIRE